MIEVPDIAIVGCGKVGTALGVLAARAGLQVRAVADADTAAAETAAERIGPNTHPGTPVQAAGAAGLVFLTVADDAIGPLCDDLSSEDAFSPGALVAHCSGALGSDILVEARQRCGCLIASMHPMQTFPDVEAAVADLPGAYCFCEGDESAVEVLMAFATEIGCRPAKLDAADKALYHAAGVLACNYVTTLLDAAGGLVARTGLDRPAALEALMPLIHATIDNNTRLGSAEALTGPIARGDVQTVRRHIEALAAADATLLELYQAAGIATVNLAVRKGTISLLKATELKQTLSDPPDPSKE